MLEASRPPGVWEVAAMDSALRLHQSSLARAYVGFTRAILDPSRSFGFREKVPYQAFADLKPGKRVSRSFRLDHLSHWRYSVKPRPNSRGRGRLHIKVKTASGFSGVVVASVMKRAEATEAPLAQVVTYGSRSGNGATRGQAGPKRHDHPRQQLVAAVAVQPGHPVHVRRHLPGGRDEIPRAGAVGAAGCVPAGKSVTVQVSPCGCPR